MSTQFDTDSVVPQERLAFWQEVVCSTFVQLDCTFPNRDQFRGHLQTHTCGDLSVVDACSSELHVVRDSRHISHSEHEFVLVSFAHEGRAEVIQQGRQALLDAGGFAIYDSRRPYELHFDNAFRQTVVQMPRTSLQQRFGNIEYVTALSLSRSNPLDRLVFDFFSGLSLLDGQLAESQKIRLAEQGIDLLAMALAERGKGEVLPGARRNALLFRIKDHIQARLADADLSLTSVSAQFGISARYINTLFQQEQTSFGRYLLAARLQHCARDLREPALAGARVSEIAYRWGFNDIAHFSRVFKTRYEMSAREYRREAF